MSTIKLQAPADFSGDFHCNSPGQSGKVYRNIPPGGAVIEADTRDVAVMLQNGFAYTVMTLAALS